MDKKIKKILERQHYAIVGGHSAIQICRWTKKSLTDSGVCYKEKFYGIKSHRCCQMSPFLGCMNRCMHCWRDIEMNFPLDIKKIDKPKKIIEEGIIKQRKMLTGFGGNNKLNKNKFLEAQEPEQFAISLCGEPTLYPYLGDLIDELRKRGKTSFLVTNGLNPDVLINLKKKKQLPTQIYISLNSPNKRHYEKWHKSRLTDAWKKFGKSLKIMKKLKGKTRTVIRMTVVREENMREEDAEGFAKLIKKAMPDFIEVKSFMAVGEARKRLSYSKMPLHNEVKNFAKKLEREMRKLGLKYKILDEKKESRVVLLGESRRGMKIERV